jgi:integrase
MRWEFLSIDDAIYRNPQGKTASARRRVPLLHDSAVVLQRRHAAQGLPREGWVFPSDSESGHVVSINKAFRAARNLAGLPRSMVLYAARHGVATELAAIGTLKEVMEVLGHSDVRTCLGYQHPQVRNLQERLNEAKSTGRIQ